jgi:DNA-directed RNA polymerase specialized sigma24 family protein
MASPKDSESETQLVERCLEHDQAAREQLVRDYQTDLLKGIRQHLQQAHLGTGEAEDIAEQFWLSQLANGYSGHADSTPSASRWPNTCTDSDGNRCGGGCAAANPERCT